MAWQIFLGEFDADFLPEFDHIFGAEGDVDSDEGEAPGLHECGEDSSDEESGEEEERETASPDRRGVLFEAIWPPPSMVNASVIRDAKLVAFTVKCNLTYFQDEEFNFWMQHVHNFPSHLKFGSMCSGSGMDSDVFYSFEDVFLEKGMSVKFENVMMAELEAGKQKWLLKQDKHRKQRVASAASNPCLFVDAKDLVDGAAPCCAHDSGSKPKGGGSKLVYKKCPVRSADLFTCGSSCK